MSLVDGNDLSVWEGGLFDRDNEDSVSILYRLLWIFTQGRAEGMGLGLNEAGRPFGVFSDIQVGRNRGDASGTFSGRSTVCYQYGRYLLWLATGGSEGTPSAANPYSGVYASQHTRGCAADIDASDYGRLDQLAERVGMKRTISSEIWHYEIYRNPDPDIDFGPFTPVVDSVFGRTSTAGDHVKPFEEDDMPFTREQLLEISTQAVFDAFLNPATVNQPAGVLSLIDGSVKNRVDALWQEIGTRLDQIIAPAIRGLFIAYRVKGTNGQWVINLALGYERHLEADDRAAMVRLGLLSRTETEISQEDFDFLRKVVAERKALSAE